MKYHFNFIPAAAAVVAFVLTFGTLFAPKYLQKKGLHTEAWNQLGSYENNGLVYSLISNARQSRVTKPENYSQETIDNITSSIVTDGKEEVKPNIIIFMSEAYTDLESAQSLSFSKDIDANFDSIASRSISGRCLTKQVGGGTANSEFEVLTGLAAGYVPPGVIAYTNYIKAGSPSIVSFLKDNGYYTTATHPYQRSFFSRETAYEHMGFDEFYSEENFEGATRCRNLSYITDDSLVDKIISLYEQNKQSGKPFFNHSVSMQNHTSFYPGEFTGDDAVSIETNVQLTDEERGALETCAAGMYLSDKALGKLVEYFEGVDEPTVILYFGDHQPYITSDTYGLYEKVGYLSDDETEAKYKYYSTPYLIWNNFSEKDAGTTADMSMFQLLPYMTEKLDMQRPDHYYFLSEFAKYCKGFTDIITLDENAKPTSEPSEKVLEFKEQFKMIQYDLLHGERYCKEAFY